MIRSGARDDRLAPENQPLAPSPQPPIRRARTIWFAYLLLLVVSIPWYFPNGNGEPLVLGFPLWCFVSLTCYVAAALLTAWQLDAVWQETERYGEPQ